MTPAGVLEIVINRSAVGADLIAHIVIVLIFNNISSATGSAVMSVFIIGGFNNRAVMNSQVKKVGSVCHTYLNVFSAVYISKPVKGDIPHISFLVYIGSSHIIACPGTAVPVIYNYAFLFKMNSVGGGGKRNIAVVSFLIAFIYHTPGKLAIYPS